MAIDPCCPRVSFVVPVYAGQRTLPELISRCRAMREGLAGLPEGLLHELLFVCDEPVDESERILCDCTRNHDWIKTISLTRNSGQHLATAVGLLHSTGDWILTLDEDLQHDPGLVGQLLAQALAHGSDLIYARSFTRTHQSSGYRDLASNASKLFMKMLTRDDYSIVSSFRLIRGELARAMANSVDARSYLDASLFAVTSQKRRGVYMARFADQRGSGASGYNLKKLLRHYGRMIMSAEFSGLRLLSAIALAVVLPLLLLMLVLLIMGWLAGTQLLAPGWLSLFALGAVTNICLFVYAVYTLKLLSALLQRSSGLPPFLVISRDQDAAHLAYLCGDQ
jgi:glycosyltransferase involved in cell wall biosynthesis